MAEDERPVAELLRELSDQTTTLVHQELELAKLEMASLRGLVLIAPAPDSVLEAYPVSTAVNRAANDFEALLAPMPEDAAVEEIAARVPARAARPKKVREPDGQASLF